MTKRATCAMCMRLRWFFGCAIPLLILIYMQPEGAQRLAAWMPPTEVIGWSIAVYTAIAFALRLREHRRKR